MQMSNLNLSKLAWIISKCVLIAIVIINIISYIETNKSTYILEDIVNNHNKLMVFNITSFENCSDTDFVFNTIYEGFDNWCSCFNNKTNETNNYTGKCKPNLFKNCTNKYGEKKEKMNNWKGTNKLCMIRANISDNLDKSISNEESILIKEKFVKNNKSSNYYELLENYSVSENSNCNTGTKNCGILDTKGNILCLPMNYLCPINNYYVSNSETQEFKDIIYGTISFNDLVNKFYYSYNAKGFILVETKISEGPVCSNPNEYNVIKVNNYSDDSEWNYKSVKECSFIGEDRITINDQFKLLDTSNKFSIYEENEKIESFSKIPSYNSELFKKEVFSSYTRPYIGWKIECLKGENPKPNEIQDIYDIKNSNYKKYKDTMIYSIVLLFFSVVTFKFIITSKKSKYIILFGIILIISYLVLGGVLLSIKFGKIDTKFYKCVDKYTTNILQYYNKLNEVEIWYSICLVILNFFNAFLIALAIFYGKGEIN